ncbi:MAG: alpha/beta fold hydrolase [Streptosporangiaceae bacterium]|nr:alpha/beta fold hydrolase [Streptosporangiaceae bacterium]
MTSDQAGRRAENLDDAAETAASLDLLLSDAALGMLRRFRPDSSLLRFGWNLARQPGRVARRAGRFATDLGSIAAGRSSIAPSPRDRRFADEAWTGNPLLRRIVQGYVAGGAFAEALLADAGLDWRDTERSGFLLRNIVDALAPSNNPLLSPLAWKALIDTGGLSAVRGLRALASDLATSPRIPAMVAPDAFEVGRDLAVSPGAVVRRTEICELIQYEPVTSQVHRFPLVIVPPMINKFYVTDLAPGRSMVEYLVSQGHQVFAISWRNPDARHRDWDLNAYGRAMAESLDAARTICGAEKASICSLCSGGILSSMVAAHLAATGQQDQIASLYLGVTVLDQATDGTGAGTAAALADDRTAALAVAASRARGYLDGRTLAEVFAWLRPNDLIWNYWVNNYLQGKTPPPFDILYWNADTTRMPAALHRDFIDIAMNRALAKPDAAAMLGSPVDLSRVTVDAYVVAGIADHLCPWQSCYRSTQLLGGDVRFVLSTSGHIASMINPPDNPKARFQVAPGGDAAGARHPAGPRDWLRAAQTVSGSWWPDYSAWLAERSGGQRDRRGRLGRKEFQPMEPAPGLYVLDR